MRDMNDVRGLIGDVTGRRSSDLGGWAHGD
jgi:hypothetical protein